MFFSFTLFYISRPVTAGSTSSNLAVPPPPMAMYDTPPDTGVMVGGVGAAGGGAGGASVWTVEGDKSDPLDDDDEDEDGEEDEDDRVCGRFAF